MYVVIQKGELGLGIFRDLKEVDQYRKNKKNLGSLPNGHLLPLGTDKRQNYIYLGTYEGGGDLGIFSLFVKILNSLGRIRKIWAAFPTGTCYP